jgi:formate--tetrahydrofolate ligase
MEFEMGQLASQHGALLKVGLFVLVQALVYLILAQSSSVFSSTKTLGKFRPSRSLSARRMVALLSDLPLGGEPSPRVLSGEPSSPLPVPTHQKKD